MNPMWFKKKFLHNTAENSSNIHHPVKRNLITHQTNAAAADMIPIGYAAAEEMFNPSGAIKIYVMLTAVIKLAGLADIRKL